MGPVFINNKCVVSDPRAAERVQGEVREKLLSVNVREEDVMKSVERQLQSRYPPSAIG